MIGCGNSELSEQLYDVGYQDIVNIDISEVVIKQMKERNASRRPQMSFLKMDMTQMEFPDASFQVVLDKGTLDAVLTDEEEKTLQQVDRMLAEVGRVLQVGGRYLCISLAQAHVLKKAVGHFSREGWMVRVHQVANSQDQLLEAEPRFPLPVFAFIMTKFRPIPGSALPIFELCAQEQGKPVRLESAERLAEAVQERQQYAWLCSQLYRKAGLGSVSLDLCSGDTGEPRYTLHVVDSPTVKPSRDNHFAIFISELGLVPLFPGGAGVGLWWMGMTCWFYLVGAVLSEVILAKARGRARTSSPATCLDLKLVSFQLPLQRLDEVGEGGW